MATAPQEKLPPTSSDFNIPSVLNPDASPFTPTEPAQLDAAASSQLAALPANAQPFKPHVKYCYFEQYGQCNKGAACPFPHRSQEQCWYEANGGMCPAPSRVHSIVHLFRDPAT